jgi:hypothetical protein
LWYQTQTGSLIHSTASLLWLTGKYTTHLTQQLPIAIYLGKNNKNHTAFIILDWMQ